MSTRIYTNITALLAVSNIDRTLAAIAKSTERLSSGLRINSAGDDPAGMARAASMRAQISGLTQAQANANSAVNMLQTAESGLTEVSSLLQSMRTLALHAANVVGSDSEAAQADQAEIEEAISSLDTIAENTSFGTVKLLDGTLGTKVYVSPPQLHHRSLGACSRRLQRAGDSPGHPGGELCKPDGRSRVPQCIIDGQRRNRHHQRDKHRQLHGKRHDSERNRRDQREGRRDRGHRSPLIGHEWFPQPEAD
jgi:hypothetical protein